MTTECPQCGLHESHVESGMHLCGICGFQWPAAMADDEPVRVPRDCNGNALADGDTVVVTKDLKVRGTSVPLKQGTVIRGIRRVEDDPDHVEGNTDRIRGLVVKTCFVRRA